MTFERTTAGKAAHDHYTSVANRNPGIPGADVRAARDDIVRALRYLLDQGHTPADLKLYVDSNISALAKVV